MDHGLLHHFVIAPHTASHHVTTNPAQTLNIPRGSISIGDIADIAIIDPNYSWTYNVNDSLSKSRNSPFHMRKLTGKALYTIVNGQIAYSHN